MRHHLEQRCAGGGPIDEAIELLLEQGYVDDARYARLFAQDKRELEQWGAERIRRTLLERGIDRSVVDMMLADSRDGSELERALELLQRRFPSAPRERPERDRALGVLLRKGYDSELALEALAQYARGTVRPPLR
jgi:regulatory protein